MSLNPIKVVQGFLKVETEFSDFIVNGPSTGIGGHARDQYRKRCDQFANAPTWARLLLRGNRGFVGRVCQPWYDAQGFDGPQLSPPFTGGQCETAYDFVVQESVSEGPQPPERLITVGAGGPISQAAVVNVSGSAYRIEGISRFGFFASNNQNFPNNFISARVVRATPQNGAPDICGDPEPEFRPGINPPPNPGPSPGPEPTDDPDNPTGPPLFPIPDYDDPLGGPTPIVAPDEPAGGVGPDQIPGNTDSAPGGGENIGDPIMVDPGSGGGGDDIDFGEPPAGKAWIGALLQFAIPTDYGIIPGSGPANPVVQRVFGNASLVFENGRGTAYRVNSGNIDLIRPSGALKVTGVYVNCLPGITYNVRPVSVDLCPENNCS